MDKCICMKPVDNLGFPVDISHEIVENLDATGDNFVHSVDISAHSVDKPLFSVDKAVENGVSRRTGLR